MNEECGIEMRTTILAVLVALATLCAFATAQETAEDWVNKDEELYKNGSYEQVAEVWEGAPQLYTYIESIEQNPAANASAQVEEVWNKTYGGQGYDVGSSVIKTKDGGYVITGWTESYGVGGLDAWLIKADEAGNEIWNKTYGGLGDEGGFSVQETLDERYILVGRTESYGAGSSDLWLIKIDSEGTEEWNKTFGGRDYESGTSVQNTMDGGYIIAGATKSYGVGGLDAWLIKADEAGNEIWNKTFGGPADDFANSALQTKDGGYIFTGYTIQSHGIDNSDLWVVKTDSKGDILWDKAFGGDDNDVGVSIKEINDGGYIITGGVNAPSAPNIQHNYVGDAWLIRTDPNGTLELSKAFRFNPSSYNLGTAVLETEDGGYVVAGYSFGPGLSGAWMIKTNSLGADQWVLNFDKSGNKNVGSIQQTDCGEYILTGTLEPYGEGEGGAWLIKANSK